MRTAHNRLVSKSATTSLDIHPYYSITLIFQCFVTVRRASGHKKTCCPNLRDLLMPYLPYWAHAMGA